VSFFKVINFNDLTCVYKNDVRVLSYNGNGDFMVGPGCGGVPNVGLCHNGMVDE